jgi:hypothetical protein
MAMLLYSIGVLISMVGLMTLGFAFGIRDFEFGHSLIPAGAIAVVGGVIVFGLGAVLRELRRGRSAERVAQPSQPARAPATAPAEAAGKVGRMPLPTPTPPVVGLRGRAEPRLDAPETPQPQRPDIFATIRAGREPMPEAENVPLSPSLTPRTAPRPEAEEAQPGFAERRPLSPATLASRSAARIDTPRTELPRSERSSRNLFDTVWPTDTRRAPEPGREPAAGPSAPERMEDHPAPPEAPRDEAPFEAPAPYGEGEPAPEAGRGSQPRPVAILKSGVIDGMAYTLYTDGSIEAQLPKGMMRFASIDELRQYLEKNS